MDIERDPILAKIERFLARHPQLTATEFGIQAVNDPALVTKLRKKNRELRRKTRATVETFMKSFKNGK